MPGFRVGARGFHADPTPQTAPLFRGSSSLPVLRLRLFLCLSSLLRLLRLFLLPCSFQGLPPTPSSPQGGLLHWPALQFQRLRLRRDRAVHGQPPPAIPPGGLLPFAVDDDDDLRVQPRSGSPLPTLNTTNCATGCDDKCENNVLLETRGSVRRCRDDTVTQVCRCKCHT